MKRLINQIREHRDRVKKINTILNLNFDENFFVELKQLGYDREIDEGFGSNVRFYTFDVTGESNEIIKALIWRLKQKLETYNVCKIIKIFYFKVDNFKYVAVTGLVHCMWCNAAKSQLDEKLKQIIELKKIEKRHIPIPYDDLKEVSL